MAIDLEKDNLDVDAMSGEESAAVKMRLEGENGLRLAAVSQVALRSKNGGIAAAQSANDKGEAEFAGLQSGAYNVSV